MHQGFHLHCAGSHHAQEANKFTLPTLPRQVDEVNGGIQPERGLLPSCMVREGGCGQSFNLSPISLNSFCTQALWQLASKDRSEDINFSQMPPDGLLDRGFPTRWWLNEGFRAGMGVPISNCQGAAPDF